MDLSAEEATKLGVIAVSGIIGGGVLSYLTVSALLSGKPMDDAPRGSERLRLVDSVAVLALGVIAVDAYREELGPKVGWEPLLLGGAAVLGFGFLARKR